MSRAGVVCMQLNEVAGKKGCAMGFLHSRRAAVMLCGGSGVGVDVDAVR